MLPRFHPLIEWREVARLLGPTARGFEDVERAFASSYGFADAVWFPYGRIAIRCFLENTARGEVAVSPFNCLALGNAIVGSGNTPHYVDTETGGFNQDASRFLEAMNSRRVVCGIAVALWGIPPDAHLYQASKPVLYDFCLDGLSEAVPPLKATDGVVYSFGWGKPLSVLKGGILCSNNLSLSQAWRRWRDERLENRRGESFREALMVKAALTPFLFRWLLPLAEGAESARRLRGFDKRQGAVFPNDAFAMPPASLLAATLNRIERRSSLRADRLAQVAAYHRGLSRWSPGKIDLPPTGHPLSHYAVRTEARDSLFDHLRKRRIFSSHRLFDRLLCDYPWLRGPIQGDLPQARKLVATTIHLPLFSGLGASEQARVCAAVGEWADYTASAAA